MPGLGQQEGEGPKPIKAPRAPAAANRRHQRHGEPDIPGVAAGPTADEFARTAERTAHLPAPVLID